MALSPPGLEGPVFAEIAGDRSPLAGGGLAASAPALIEIPIAAVVRGDSGGAVVQRGDQGRGEAPSPRFWRAALTFELAGCEG